MDDPAVSVLTLVKGRDAHLRHLLAGLDRGTRRPDRCVVVDMGASPAVLPSCGFPVLRHRLPSAGLPLAAARNAAARLAAGTEALVFLDVDCIPARDLVEVMAREALAAEALVCCEIRYLPAGASAGFLPAEDALLAAGRPHPERPFPAAGLRAEPNAGLFWSLAFSVRRSAFERIGGFDERYTGYGGEDTDLAFRAREAGLPLLFTGDTRAFHQHHAIHDPPLQHFADILRNARRFRARHGIWPMDGWLAAFARMELIDPVSPDATDIVVLRAPTAVEVAAAACSPDRTF